MLIDSGFASAASRAITDAFLAGNGLAPEQLTAVALTHFHNDHVGGAAWLQRQGVPILLHETEAELIAAGAAEAFDHALLAFDVPAFTVDRPLRDGDVVDAGERQLHVVHVPSHTSGLVAFWEPEDRVLFSGDLIQDGDVGWVRFDDPASLAATEAAVRRLAALEPALVVPGHGPVVTDPGRAIAENLERYASWRGEPSRPALHACRRIIISTLALTPSIEAELAELPWARVLAGVLDTTPAQAVGGLLEGHLAAGRVVRGDDGRLRTTVPHEPIS